MKKQRKKIKIKKEAALLRKKRIIALMSLMCIAILCCTIKITNNTKENNKTVETVSLPISNKVVVIDAGHGIPDEGAENENGLTESAINLKIALKVQNLLEQSGCTVILTRSDENAIYDAGSDTIKEMKVSDIKNRVKIGNESSADAFVSIHLNKIPQSQYYGWQTFYKNGNEQSINLATNIQNGLNEAINRENKRVPLKISGIYIVDNVEIPLSIVECGFLSNPQEAELLQQDEYQNQLAWGIYIGIINYFYSK